MLLHSGGGLPPGIFCQWVISWGVSRESFLKLSRGGFRLGPGHSPSQKWRSGPQILRHELMTKGYRRSCRVLVLIDHMQTRGVRPRKYIEQLLSCLFGSSFCFIPFDTTAEESLRLELSVVNQTTIANLNIFNRPLLIFACLYNPHLEKWGVQKTFFACSARESCFVPPP